MIVDQLVAVLGYKLEGQQNLKKFEGGVARAQKQVVAASAAIARAAAAAGAALTALGGVALAKGIIKTGSEFEKLELTLGFLEGSAKKAGERMEWLRKFAINTPLDLKGATSAYVKLKNFGIDPTNGSLQALVDSNAMMAGSQEQLEGIILAIGQAWTKQKFQAEEANQLLERGVPAWELLSKAMGKSTKEVQELSEKGKIGRKEMQLLIDAMGARSRGASEKFAKTLQGTWDKVTEQWTDFKKEINDAGFLDEVKMAIDRVRAALDNWEKSGGMKGAARGVSFFLSNIVRGMQKAGDLIRDGIAKAGPKVKQAWDTISKMVLAGNWKGIGEGWGKLVADGFGAVGRWIRDKIKGGESASNLLEAGKDIVRTIMLSWYDMVKSFWSTIGTEIYNAGNWSQTGTDMANELLEGMKQVGNKITDWLKSLLPDWVRNALSLDGAGATGAGGDSSPGVGGAPRSLRERNRRVREALDERDSGGLSEEMPSTGGDALAGPAVIGMGGGEHRIRPHQSRVAQEAYNFYRSKGLSREAALGILANIQNESAYDPRARGDNGASHGLYQHQGPRRRAIQAATGINMSTASSLDQHRGAWHELTAGSDPGARRTYQMLKRPGITSAEAAAIWSRNFERPLRDHGAYRGNVARSLEKQIQERNGVAGPSLNPHLRRNLDRVNNARGGIQAGLMRPNNSAVNVGDVIVNPPPGAKIDKAVGGAIRTAVATGAAPRPARMQASPVA